MHGVLADCPPIDLSCSVHSSHLQSHPQSSLSFWGAVIPIVQNKLDLNFLSYSIDWEENPVPQARGRFSLRKVRCFAFLSGGFHKSYGECRLSQDKHIISNTSRTPLRQSWRTKSGKHGFHRQNDNPSWNHLESIHLGGLKWPPSSHRASLAPHGNLWRSRSPGEDLHHKKVPHATVIYHVVAFICIYDMVTPAARFELYYESRSWIHLQVFFISRYLKISLKVSKGSSRFPSHCSPVPMARRSLPVSWATPSRALGSVTSRRASQSLKASVPIKVTELGIAIRNRPPRWLKVDEGGFPKNHPGLKTTWEEHALNDPVIWFWIFHDICIHLPSPNDPFHGGFLSHVPPNHPSQRMT